MRKWRSVALYTLLSMYLLLQILNAQSTAFSGDNRLIKDALRTRPTCYEDDRISKAVVRYVNAPAQVTACENE